MGIKINAVIFTLLFCTQALGVYGGEPIDPMMRRSQVNIKFKLGLCSGVLISPTVVASAAHCKDLFRVTEFAAWLNGDVKVENKDCDHAKIIDYAYAPYAKKIFPRGKQENQIHAPDIILFRLESPLCSASPAEIQSAPLLPGDEFSITGYGGRGGQDAFFRNSQISLKVIETPEERRKLTTTDDEYFLRLLDLAPASYFFALPTLSNTTMCSGDSGGPAFINEDGKMLLYGINGAVFPHNEKGAEKCGNGYAHAFTPIAPHFDWIKSTIDLWTL